MTVVRVVVLDRQICVKVILICVKVVVKVTADDL